MKSTIELHNTLNDLRTEAGLNIVWRHGASKQALQVEINRASRGEFKEYVLL